MNKIKSLTGFWRSVGYNQIMEITPEEVIMYDTCKLGTVESQRFPMETAEILLLILAHTKDDEITLIHSFGITSYKFKKIEALPEPVYRPEKEPQTDPVLNYDIFWEYFNENYCFFDLHNVNWDDVHKETRPKVTADTKEDELLDVMTSMIRKLEDDHVSIEANGRQIGSLSVPDPVKNQWVKQFKNENGENQSGMEIYSNGFKYWINEMTEKVLLESPKFAANDMVVWGKIKPNIGYLIVAAMFGFNSMNPLDPETIPALKATLDEVMQDFKDMDAVIIDARFNPGGLDAASIAITNRFTDKKHLIITKKAREDDGFVNEQQIFIQPEGDTPFTKPVAFLTSQSTISAAEIWTMSVMPLPHVTRMGDRTQGVLSDVLTRKLPNGWEIGLSNEVYTASDGKLYEMIGVPPHIKLPAFGEENFYEGAIELVNQAKNHLINQIK